MLINTTKKCVQGKTFKFIIILTQFFFCSFIPFKLAQNLYVYGGVVVVKVHKMGKMPIKKEEVENIESI